MGQLLLLLLLDDALFFILILIHSEKATFVLIMIKRIARFIFIAQLYKLSNINREIFFLSLLSAIASMTIGRIHKMIHEIRVVAIENIDICFPMAIIVTILKADFLGDHPFTRRGMSTRQPATQISTTVIRINRMINDFCA